ncbi:jg21917 [Pararge aegeria aegeria]|uniref:Jg21917 protein n=1 Tax=Pararge aegeria aegeria TaxID=348720 RepID=A0A8S4QJZ8_9NEOP|nr:jg21917 [Pararge aegeria aegeria]
MANTTVITSRAAARWVAAVSLVRLGCRRVLRAVRRRALLRRTVPAEGLGASAPLRLPQPRPLPTRTALGASAPLRLPQPRPVSSPIFLDSGIQTQQSDLDTNKQVTEVDKEIKAAESTAPAPLRRPHSPVASNSKSDENNDRSRKNFMPAGQTRFQQGNRNQNHQNTKNSSNRGGVNTGPRNTNTRRPMRQNDADEGEQDSWEPRAPPKSDSGPHSVPKAVVPNVASTPVAIPAPSKPYQPVNKEPELPKVKTVPEVKKVLPLVTVSDTTPTRKIVPKNYLIGTLAIGDTGLLSVDVKASDCRSKASGYVCLSLHEKCEQDYQMLCADYSVESETAADYKPNPGELFSYCNPEDGAYYRARLLNATSAALIDSSKIVNISPTDKLKIITPKYAELVEFSCVLDAPNVKIGDNVRITLKAKTPEGYKVQIENAETGASVGEGEVCRWMPLVEYPVPKPLPTAPAPAVEVPRPNLKNNSTVLLVEASALDRALVRPADTESMRKFDTVLQDVLQFGMNGNIEINTLETIYACPQELDLNTKPTVVSVAKIQTNAMALTPAAEGYIEILRDTNAELILTLPDGSASAPSGAEVKLSIAKNKESVNKKIELMCTPDWKKIEENGGDVVDTKPLMLSDLEYLELPAGGGEFEILDVSMISQGALCGCQKIPGRPGADATLAAMTKQIEAYCNSELGKKPYLPKLEELCIAQFPPYPQWFRAVLCEQLGGPGGSEVRLCYIDYGNLETVPVTVIRKMLPEFVNGHPALASQLEIRGWPESPTNEMLVRAAQYMKIDEEGRGYLTVTRCEKIDAGLYKVDAPDLLKAMGAL